MTPLDPQGEEVEAAAARWLARCDRGLSPVEQDAYLEWLRANPSHGASIARLRDAWARLDKLRTWQPSHSGSDNPDLLAPAVARRRMPVGMLAIAATLIVALLFAWNARHTTDADSRGAKVVPGAERLILEDGSLVELNTGAKVEVVFSREERRVRLLGGEALFSVARNVDRPFVVDTGGYEVRAVGTAFSVQRGAENTAVLVTEGAVRMDAIAAATGATVPAATALISRLVAGQQAIVTPPVRAGAEPVVVTRDLSPVEIDMALGWRAIRLEFDDMALQDVIAEFNRYNARQLVVRDSATAALIIGGSFRADNLEAFVRLLETGFNVSATPGDREIELCLRP